MKSNRFYLIIFSLLLLSFSVTTDSELVATIEDADGDGLPDSYEIENNNDPYDRNDTITDADGDGLTLLEEFLYGTSDQHLDSDFDTLPDDWEVDNGRNPLMADYQISTGYQSSCALTDNGVVCWGSDNGTLDVPELYRPTEVAVGSNYACALADSGEVCWGTNPESLFSVETEHTCVLANEMVSCNDLNPPALSNPLSLDSNEDSACAIDDSGIVCWGHVPFGSPPLIESASQVSVGASSACALALDGVTCWGYNYYGENEVPMLMIDPDGDGYTNQEGADAYPLDPTRWLLEDTNTDLTQDEVTTLTLKYANSTTPIAGVKVIMTESDGTVTVLATDSNGQITLPSTTNTYTLTASLAETGEDPITLIDAIHILQYGGELRTLTDDQKTAADVNADGEVDILDAIWILQHLGELRTLDSSLIFLDANTGNPLSQTTFSPGDTPSISVIRKGDVDGDFDPTLITDHAPIITGTTTLVVDENETAVSTLVGMDADGDTLTYSITGGTDMDFFTIDASTGALSFNTAPDYENDKTSYLVSVTVTDGVNVITKSLSININDVNENLAPFITNMPESLSVVENSSIIYDFDATDPEGDSIYFTISGLDSSLFKINSSGVLSFINAPDYENPQDVDKDNIYDVEVSVTDTNPAAKKSMARALGFVTSNSDYDSSVRVTNFDEDIISFVLSGEDGTESSGPKITIDMEVDSYTQPQGVQILLWRGEQQYWTSSLSVSTEDFKVNYEYTFNTPTNSPSGIWEVRIVRLLTSNGNYDYSKTLLSSKGFPTSVSVYNPNSDENDPELISISAFEVTGNDSDASTNIVVKLVTEVTDPENGFQKAGGYFKSPNYDGGWGQVWSWASVDTSVTPNTATFSWVLDPKTVSGEYSVVDLRFYDKAGNLIFYHGNDGSLGLFGSYKITIDNPIQDNQTPQLSDFQMEGSVDADGRKTITVRTLIDNGASQDTPIGRQYIRIYGPNTGNIDKDNFVLQDDGYYKLTIPLALASADGDYTVSYWFISDRALNDNKLTGDEINSLGFSKTITFN